MWTTRKFTEVVAVHCYFNRRRLLTPKATAFKPPLLQCNSSMKKITKAINFLVWKITRNKYNNPKVLPKRLWEFNNLEDKFFCTTWLSCTQVAHNIIFFLEEKLYVCVFFTVYTPVSYDVFLFWVLFPQKRVPHFKTMFSDLRHYPRYSIHLEVTDPVPKFIPRQWRGYAEQNREALIRYTT